jgi:hypothetical protein
MAVTRKALDRLALRAEDPHPPRAKYSVLSFVAKTTNGSGETDNE